MARYSEEFKRNAIALTKKVGITKASRELGVARCSVYHWCKEMEVDTFADAEDPSAVDLDEMINEKIVEDQPLQESDAREPDNSEQDLPEAPDSIATAMALLVIENTQLREVIKHLREVISGLTDHMVL